MTTHAYPPCPACHGLEYFNIPNMHIEVSKATAVLGMRATQGVGHWVVSLIVCRRCGRTDMFTLNAPVLASQIPNSQGFSGGGGTP